MIRCGAERLTRVVTVHAAQFQPVPERIEEVQGGVRGVRGAQVDLLPGQAVRAQQGAAARQVLGPGEAAQAIGQLNLTAGQGVAFTLGGAALDAAAKAGHGFFGMRFSDGQSVFGDTLDLTGMKASARL